MTTKIFEVFDRSAYLRVLATRLDHRTTRELFLLNGADLTNGQIQVTTLTPYVESHSDPSGWGNGTMRTVHEHLIERWDVLNTGDVVDVEHILGEKLDAAKTRFKPLYDWRLWAFPSFPR